MKRDFVKVSGSRKNLVFLDQNCVDKTAETPLQHQWNVGCMSGMMHKNRFFFQFWTKKDRKTQKRPFLGNWESYGYEILSPESQHIIV